MTLSSLERIIKRVSEAVITLKQDYLKWPKGTLKFHGRLEKMCFHLASSTLQR